MKHLNTATFCENNYPVHHEQKYNIWKQNECKEQFA